MLTKIIVDSFAKLIEISLWVILAVSFIGGWIVYGFWGAIFGIIIAFVYEVLLFGGLIILQDIRQILLKIEKQKQE